MTDKILIILFLGLIFCATCFGQTPFHGLTAGKSTRTDAEKVLGRPVKEVSQTLIEYHPKWANIAKVYVQYRKGSTIVERIESLVTNPLKRADVLKALGLQEQPVARGKSSTGDLQEYFGSPAYVVLTYDGANATSGVARTARYSRELFAAATAKLSNGSPSSAARKTPAPAAPRPPSTTSTRSSPPSGGGAGGTSVVTTTRQGTTESTSPAQPGTTTNPEDEETTPKEITLPEAELRKLVGRYEFIQGTEPSFKQATVTYVGGKLQWTMGAATSALIPIAPNDSAGPNADRVDCKVANQPGVKISFRLSGGKVENLFYTEERSDPLKFGVAVPRH